MVYKDCGWSQQVSKRRAGRSEGVALVIQSISLLLVGPNDLHGVHQNCLDFVICNFSACVIQDNFEMSLFFSAELIFGLEEP